MEDQEVVEALTEEDEGSNTESTDVENLILVEDSFGRGINKKVLLVTKGVSLKKLHLMSK